MDVEFKCIDCGNFFPLVYCTQEKGGATGCPECGTVWQIQGQYLADERFNDLFLEFYKNENRNGEEEFHVKINNFVTARGGLSQNLMVAQDGCEGADVTLAIEDWENQLWLVSTACVAYYKAHFFESVMRQLTTIGCSFKHFPTYTYQTVTDGEDEGFCLFLKKATKLHYSHLNEFYEHIGAIVTAAVLHKRLDEAIYG